MRLSEVKIGKSFVCRLDHGSDLYDSIIAFTEKLEVKNAVFFAIGALKKAKLAFYDQGEKKYSEINIEKPLEVISCMGNVSSMKKKTMVHAHVSLADKDGSSYGGHLIKGSIVFATELFLMKVEGIDLEREYDPVTGLNLLNLPLMK